MTIAFDAPLDDPLDDIFGGPVREPVAHSPVAPVAVAGATELGGHWERCSKCAGSGMTRWGACFRCKGQGGRRFATDAGTRAANRAASAHRRARTVADNWTAFAEQHAAVAEWLVAKAGRFEFAASLKEQVEKRGDLSEKQIATALRFMAQDDIRREEQAAGRVARTTEMDVTGLDAVFAVARAKGAIKAALRTGSVTFSLASASGKNPGAIYAKRPDGEYLGKITGGKFVASMACTPADRDAVVEASKDPKAAAIRYAAATDRCSVCGTILTDPVSKANRIGPVCAAKFGW